MSRSAAARTQHHDERALRRPRPHGAADARRMSGPVAPTRSPQPLRADGSQTHAAAYAPPRPRTPLRPPLRLAAGGAAIALRVADSAVNVSASPMMDRLVRSRAWVVIIGVGLIGIVAMQVSLLKLNSGIGRAVDTVATLERSNASLKAQVSEPELGRPHPVAGRPARLRHARARRRHLPARGGQALRRPARRAPDARRRPDDRRPGRRRVRGQGAGIADRCAAGGRHDRHDRFHRHDRAGPDRHPGGTGRDGARGGGHAGPADAGPGRDAGARDRHEHRHERRRRRRDRRPADHLHRRGDHAIVGLTERRIGLLFAIFLALLLIAASRAAWLGAVKGESLQAVASTQQVEVLKVPARRGAIVDRNGIELAVSEPADDIAVTPYLVKQPMAAARRLARLLDTTQGKLLTKFEQKGGFVYLARNVPGTRSAKIKQLDVPGLQFVPSSRREYPRKWLASQVLGWVGTDGDGLAGLEYAKDDLLRGTDGERRIVKDALGEPIVLQETKRAAPGQDLRLTLDAELQGKVENVLAEVGLKWRPKGATALVMDPYSNTVLALANWPRVDANDSGGAPGYAAQNRAVGFNYEPGSTFKPFTVAGALEEKVVTPTDVFHLPPTIDVADRTIKEAHERGTVDLTTTQILAQSSNVGTVRIGQRLGETRFDRWVRRFGFGRPTGVELPGEESGQVLEREDYSGSSIGNLPIGQGESVTPLQLATAYSAIANGGILRRPRLISEIDGRRTAMPRGRRIIRPTHRRAAAHDARGRRRRGRHRQRGGDPRLHAGRQDRHGEQDRPPHRRVLQDALHRLVRRLRAGAQAQAARDRHGRRAAGRDLRRRGRGPRLPGDHALRPAVPRRRAQRLIGPARRANYPGAIGRPTLR